MQQLEICTFTSQVLRNFGDPSGGVILLLSDGEDSNFPSDDVTDLVDAGVIVDSIALGQSGESGMEFVAVQTGMLCDFIGEPNNLIDTILHTTMM